MPRPSLLDDEDPIRRVDRNNATEQQPGDVMATDDLPRQKLQGEQKRR